jgi:hypothetical protein
MVVAELLMVLIVIPLASNTIAGLMIGIKYWLFYKVYTKKTRYKPFRLKPIDCSLCLSFHLTWIYLISMATLNPFIIILLALASGYVGSAVERYL